MSARLTRTRLPSRPPKAGRAAGGRLLRVRPTPPLWARAIRPFPGHPLHAPCSVWAMGPVRAGRRRIPVRSRRGGAASDRNATPNPTSREHSDKPSGNWVTRPPRRCTSDPNPGLTGAPPTSTTNRTEGASDCSGPEILVPLHSERTRPATRPDEHDESPIPTARPAVGGRTASRSPGEHHQDDRCGASPRPRRGSRSRCASRMGKTDDGAPPARSRSRAARGQRRRTASSGSGGSGTASGWRIAARSSVPSTTRGPGREK